MIINRRKFIKDITRITGGTIVGGYLLDSIFFSAENTYASIKSNIFVAKNGTPAENVTKVIDMRFGGIENFIGHDDVVVINPNGQYVNQGATNCALVMGLIDLILNRPGGFDGEIIFTENTQFNEGHGYWYASASGMMRNGPYNFNDMITYYQNNGHSNVNAVKLRRNQDDSTQWPIINSPQQGQGWVRPEWTSPTYGCLFYLPYPIFRSPYSHRLIDLKNGVYDNGYANQPTMKFIKMPTLNNHGTGGSQDYAGVTSSTKSFLGITEIENSPHGYFNDNLHTNLHAYDGWRCSRDEATLANLTGEAIGAWINTCRKPDLFITSAEWIGYGSRYGTDAVQAKTVGLGEDPVSLDYYMSKYHLWPLLPDQQYFNPDYDINNNNTRQTLNGCHSQGLGTLNEAEMSAFVYDFNAPNTFRFDIDRTIKKFKEGKASQREVLDLIDKYNSGQ